MRNLKKILALVLALVMSLSLMATASASDFADASSITDRYATAVEVLSGLKVFKGYAEDGTFRPQGDITRAEVATIIYRIATGDAEDAQASIYTNMTTSFTDLGEAEWARGYVNYCHNAEIIKGESATKFNPNGKISGYATLAMILRAMGYGRNGEFEGPQWEIMTAAKAKEIGLIDNVIEAQLGSDAPRELVAEILFRALLTEMVDYTVLNGYVPNGKMLGKENLGLEGFEGVIVANEYADLNSTQVLADGKTQIQVEGEDNVRTLNYSTKITEVGESRIVYTQNGSKVLYLSDTDESGNPLNTTKEYGEGITIGSTNSNGTITISATKFQEASGMSYAAGTTEFYQNFGQTGTYTSDYRIEYVITFSQAFDGYGTTSADYPVSGNWSNNNLTLDRVIPAGQTITQTDYDNMLTIFTYSNGIRGTEDDQNILNRYEIGQVFVGTQTKKDVSDELSFNTFVETYLNPITYDAAWARSWNGQWVKFIDNNGDGKCDYAFLTRYNLDEAVSSYTTKDGDVVMQYYDGGYYSWDDDDHSSWEGYTVRYMQDDETIERNVQVGDIVLLTLIDNQLLVSKAESVTTQANSYNYKNDEITAANGETYGQSWIGNRTDMLSLIASMAPKTDYEMFLDKFGFVRAYRQPGDTQYALVTEIYYTNNYNGNLLQNWPMTVELTMPDENGNPVTKEYNLANTSSPLVSYNRTAWTYIKNFTQTTSSYYNVLQPAIAHLGVKADQKVPNLNTNETMTYWNKGSQIVLGINSFNGSTEFDYGAQTYTGTGTNNSGNAVPVARSVSFTNVAVVNSISGNDATISGAAQLALNRTTGAPLDPDYYYNYAVDYIQLTKANVAKGAASFAVDSSTAAQYNNVVNADDDTEIYVVYNGGVKYFKGYTNMPALNADTVGSIHAAYAVARQTSMGATTGTSVNGRTYWIADVLVFEVEDWKNTNEVTSIALAYYTAYQQLQSANGVAISTLNSKADPAKVDLIPGNLAWSATNNWWTTNNWSNNWEGYGFYRVYNEAAAGEGVMTAQKIENISKDFSDDNIYAGTITREVDLATSRYIPVNVTGTQKNGVLQTEVLVSISSGNVYGITVEDYWTNGAYDNNGSKKDYRAYTEANNLQFNNTQYSQVKANDRIIWVGGCAKNGTVNNANFIVDLGSNIDGSNNLLDNTNLWLNTPYWLDNLWDDIFDDYNTDPSHDGEIAVTFELIDTDDGNKEIKHFTEYVEVGKNLVIDAEELELDGRVITGAITAKDQDDNNVTVWGDIDANGNVTVVTKSLAKNDSVTVTVNYTEATYSLNVKGDGSVGSYNARVNKAVLANGNNTTATWFALDTTGSTLTGLQRGSTFTVETSAPAAGTELDVVVTHAKDVKVTTSATDGSLTITGTINGPVVITVSAEAKVYDLVWAGETENLDMTGMPTTYTWGSASSITLTAKTGYDVSAATITASGNCMTLANTSGTFSVTENAAPAGDTITLTVAGVKEATYTVTLKVEEGLTAWYSIGTNESTNGKQVKGGEEDATLSVKPGQTVYVVTQNGNSNYGVATSTDFGSPNGFTAPDGYIGASFVIDGNGTITVSNNDAAAPDNGEQLPAPGEDNGQGSDDDDDDQTKNDEPDDGDSNDDEGEDEET